MADPIIKKITELTELTAPDTGDLFVIVDLSEGVAADRTKKLAASNVKLFNSAQISDGIVAESKIAVDAVTTAKIKDLNVTSGKLATGAVIAGKIATGGVSASTQFATQVVDTAALKDANVTEGKLATGAVTADKIGTGAVTETKIGTGAVTNAKLGTGAVTQVKLSGVVRTVVVPIYGDDDNIIVKNHPRRFSWANALNGHVIQRVSAIISGAPSSSGSVTIQVNNAGGMVAEISIVAGAYSAETTSINATYKTATSMAPVGINVTAAGTGAKGLSIYLEMLG
jgi:hypothetical protein